MPFILKPWFWSLGLGYRRGSMAYWYAETATGVALIVTLLVLRRRAARLRSAGVRAPA